MTQLLANPSKDAEDEVHLRDVWNFWRRNRLPIVGCLALSLAASALYIWRATPIYEASTSIRIDEEQSELPVLDALKTLSTGSEVSTEIEVLRSRTLAEDVVDSLGLQVAVAEPERTPRRDVLAFVRGSPDATQAGYRLERQS